jgi:hypothetical protein
LKDYVRNLYPDISDGNLTTVAKNYPVPQTGPRDEILGVMDLFGDLEISCNNYYLTEAGIGAANVSLYRYVFNAPPATQVSDVFDTVSPSHLLQIIITHKILTETL